MFTYENANNNLYKVDACKKILPSEKVLSYHKDYESFVTDGNISNSPPDIILCFANEKNIWSTIQENYPPLVIHATTTSNWGINFGRHIPLVEWCIMCRFHNQIDHDFNSICGTGVIKTEGNDEILGSLPFVSPAAGVIVLAELMKLSMVNYPINKNFIQYNYNSKTEGNIFLSMQRSKEKQCPICSTQEIDFYETY